MINSVSGACDLRCLQSIQDSVVTSRGPGRIGKDGDCVGLTSSWPRWAGEACCCRCYFNHGVLKGSAYCSGAMESGIIVLHYFIETRLLPQITTRPPISFDNTNICKALPMAHPDTNTSISRLQAKAGRVGKQNLTPICFCHITYWVHKAWRIARWLAACGLAVLHGR